MLNRCARRGGMITFKVQKDIKAAQTYFDEHLSSNEHHKLEEAIRGPLDDNGNLIPGAKPPAPGSDYYVHSANSEGRWGGQLAEKLGIRPGSTVTKEQFEYLLKNQNPSTGKSITVRTRTDGSRRLYFDATISAPKSVSIMALTIGDKRLLKAHDAAVKTAMDELEKYVQTRVRKDGRSDSRYSYGLLNAQFTHTTSRANDPQLHTHNVIFNVSWDPVENRFKALESFAMYERSKFITEVYRNELAKEVRSLGYEIEKAVHGWEIKGVDKSILALFSKRTASINEAIKVREKKIGRKLTNNEISHISHQTRAAKNKSLTYDKILDQQWEQLSLKEKKELCYKMEMAKEKSKNKVPEPTKENGYPFVTNPHKEAIKKAVDKVFERKSVAKDFELVTEAIKTDYGNLKVTDLHDYLESNKDLIHAPAQEKFAHKAHLIDENKLCEFVEKTRNKFKPIEPKNDHTQKLRTDQKEVYKSVLKSTNQVIAIRGAAGTGKSHLISQLVKAYHDEKIPVVAIAPTTGATQNLKRDLGVPATTVQDFLLSSKNRKWDNVIILDEAGLVSLSQMKSVFKEAEFYNSRVLLVGDSKQHHSVKAGDSLRVMEKYADLETYALIDITRQKDTMYKEAVKELSNANIDRAWALFEEMNVIKEKSELPEIREDIANEYVEKIKEGKNTLVVAPTWDEIKQTTTEIREKLKEADLIAKDEVERTTYSSVKLTDSEKHFGTSYVPDHHYVTWLKDHEDFEKHSHWKVTEVKDDSLTLTNGERTESVDLREVKTDYFDVSEEKTTPIAVGDKLLMQSNNRDYEDKNNNLTNGEVLTVKSIDDDGSIKTEEGKTIPNYYDTFDHGYVSTSYASQGRTCDHVIVSMSVGNGKAISGSQFYVSTSRARESLSIYMDDKDYIHDRLSESCDRESALELLEEKLMEIAQREEFKETIEREKPEPEKDKDEYLEPEREESPTPEKTKLEKEDPIKPEKEEKPVEPPKPEPELKKPYLERDKEFYKELSLKAAPAKELTPEKTKGFVMELDFGP